MPFPTEMDTSLQQCSKLLSVKGAHDTVHTGAIFLRDFLHSAAASAQGHSHTSHLLCAHGLLREGVQRLLRDSCWDHLSPSRSDR